MMRFRQVAYFPQYIAGQGSNVLLCTLVLTIGSFAYEQPQQRKLIRYVL